MRRVCRVGETFFALDNDDANRVTARLAGVVTWALGENQSSISLSVSCAGSMVAAHVPWSLPGVRRPWAFLAS